jgi:hypothetical protein
MFTRNNKLSAPQRMLSPARHWGEIPFFVPESKRDFNVMISFSFVGEFAQSGREIYHPVRKIFDNEF